MDRRTLALLSVSVALALLVSVPLPHEETKKVPRYGYVTRTRQVPYTVYEDRVMRDLLDSESFQDSLPDCHYWELSYPNLPDKLIVDFSFTSTDDLQVRIYDATGLIYDQYARRFDMKFYAKGPTLYVKILNPGVLCTGPPAVVNGYFKVYHEYVKKVPVTKYRTETYQSWEVVGYDIVEETVYENLLSEHLELILLPMVPLIFLLKPKLERQERPPQAPSEGSEAPSPPPARIEEFHKKRSLLLQMRDSGLMTKEEFEKKREALVEEYRDVVEYELRKIKSKVAA